MKRKRLMASIGIVIVTRHWPCYPAGEAKAGKMVKIDGSKCGGFTTADAAKILQVPAAAIQAWTQNPHESFWTCSFASGKLLLEFSVAVSSTVEDAMADMVRYRRNMEETAATDAFKDSLPDGAWSGIAGLGDEAVWTDINRTLRARQGNVIVQVLAPAGKPAQVKVAAAFFKNL